MTVDLSLFEEQSKQEPVSSENIDMDLFSQNERQAVDANITSETQSMGTGGSFDKSITDKALDVSESVGKTIVGGGLKAFEGVSTLGYDISAMIGPKGGRDKAKEYAKIVRDTIPSIKPESTLEDIGQTLVQYGIPATASIKLIGGVVKGAPWAVRFMSELTAGGLSDFLVASPEDIPITYKPESELGKRAVTGAEGAAIPVAIRPVAGAAKMTGRFFGKFGRYLFSPRKVAEDAVGGSLVDQSIDPEKAIGEIRKALLESTKIGVEPTTGTASGDAGLIGLERGIASGGETSAEMVNRQELNMRAISDALEKVTTNRGGNGQKAKDFFEAFVDARLEGKVNAFDIAEKRLKTSEFETDNLIKEFAEQGGNQANSSLFLDDMLRGELETLTRKKNKLYSAIDPNNEVEITKDRLRTAYDLMVKKKGKLDSAPSKIPQELKNIIFGVLKKPKKGGEEIPLYFGDLQNLRPDLAEAISTARADNQGAVVKRLVEFKQALESETEYLTRSGGEAGQRASEANKFYREEYVPKFKEGVGNLYRKAIRRDAPWPGTAIGKKFLNIATGSTESASQLKTIATEAADPIVAKQAIRDHLISDVADLMTTATGKTAKDRLVRYLNQRPIRETLNQFPEIKAEITKFQNTIGTSLEKQNRIAQAVDAAKLELKKTDKEIRKSATKFFVATDPIRAIGGVLNSPNPVGNMGELVRLAKQDPSGEAVLGLRQSLSDYLEETVRGTKEVGGIQEVMRSKIVKLFQNKRIHDAISKLYTKPEMDVLQSMHKELQVLDRINKQVTANSSTAPIQQNIQRARIVLASIYGIVKGRGLFAISGFVMQVTGRDPKTIANQVITDAMLDPELAANLMRKNLDSKAVQEKVKGYLTTYIMNNILAVPQKENE